jgi:Ca-activated chloride channel family protein
MGEVGARPPGDLGEARFPLSIQRLQVRTRIEDDLAITTVEETFFNPADTTLEGIFRVRLPEGAILSRFAIDRRGRLIDGYVKERETAQRQYQAQVYQGSTHDPALLEWDAPGSFKARLYPLPPGSTRRVLYTYSEWLQPHGDGGALRTFRYPMAGAAGEGAPLIQELDIEVDATSAGAKELRAGLGALLTDEARRVVMQRTDYVPSADLVVELLGANRPEDVARLYRAPHQDPPRPGARRAQNESDYVLLRATPVPAPLAAERSPLDLVLLVDVSAATDATHLAMARTLVESLLRRLNPEDRVVLLGADLDAHELSATAAKKAPTPQLTAATPENLQQLLARLGASATGGATDLGAALSQAAALLTPGRPGAVLYVGDAQPTVGELDLPTLRERLDRLPAPLRLYGVGIGAEANLDLLSGLCQLSAGQAYRVSDRAAAAETALGIITHLTQPAVSRLKVDVGSGLDRVYPRQSVALRAGEPLFIMARLRQNAPTTVQIEGMYAGKPFTRSFRVESHSIDDTADLRLRWSQARLLQLLDSGATTEEVAELGVRQNLVTPFTSFYVPSEDEVAQLERETPTVHAAGCSSRSLSSAAPEAPAMVAAASVADPSTKSPTIAVRGPAEKSREGGRDRDKDDRKPSDDAPTAGSAAPSVAADEAPAPEPAKAMAAPSSPPPPPKPMAMPEMEMAKESGSYRDAKMARPMAAKKASAQKPDYDGVAKNKDSFGDSGVGLGNIGLKGAGRGGGGSGGPATGSSAAPHGSRSRALDRAERKAEKSARLRSSRMSDDLESSLAPVVAANDGDITVVVGIFTHRPRGCSAASTQPLDERRDLWRERLGLRTSVRRALEVYQDADRGCELPRWTDRRQLLKLMLRNCGGPSGMVSLYQHFNDQPEEQEFLRQAILGEVRSPRDLRVIFDGLGLGDDERITLAQEVIAKAKTPAERLTRIADLLIKWPGDLRLRLLRMEVEEQLGRSEAARRTAEEVRRDPYADAQARTAVGELFVRLGDEAAARRAFSEIVEFSPREPLARRRLGDLYRAHGWYDEAYRQYQTLLVLQSGDQSVLLLMAMAAAGAGHIEEALGLEQRVIGTAEPGSESGLSKVALLSTSLRLAELREEARKRNDAEGLARLVLRSRQSGAQGLARPVRVLLSWAHPEASLELRVAAPGESLGPPSDLAPQFGLLGWHSAKDQKASDTYSIEVQRVDSSLSVNYPALLTVITDEGEASEKLWQVPLKLDAAHKTVRLTLRASQLNVEKE